MRNITSAMAEGFAASNVQPAILAEMFFDSATLRVWSGVGTLTWGDREFTGGGNLVSISDMQENQSLEARGIICSLNGLPSTTVSLILSENQRGRPFHLYLALYDTESKVLTEDGGEVLTEDGGNVLAEVALVSDPYRIFNGLMDTIKLSDDGNNAVVNLSVENLLIIGQRNKVRRYTAEDQKKYYPNDKGLDFIPALQDKEIVW